MVVEKYLTEKLVKLIDIVTHPLNSKRAVQCLVGCGKNCNAAGFFTLFPMCIKNGPPPKGHPAHLTQLWEALESTWASIPVEHFVQSIPRQIEAVLRAKGGGVLMFGILSVSLYYAWEYVGTDF
jgi:hypothetical protein